MHLCSKSELLCLLFIASAATIGGYIYLDTLWYKPVTTEKTLRSQPREDLSLFHRAVRRRRELMLCQCEKISSSMKVGRFRLNWNEGPLMIHNWRNLHQVSRNAYAHLLAFPREDILWCPVFKAATSSWYRNLLRLSHLPQKAQGDLIKTQLMHGGNRVLVEPLLKTVKSASLFQACAFNYHSTFWMSQKAMFTSLGQLFTVTHLSCPKGINVTMDVFWKI